MLRNLIAIGFILVLTNQGRAINGPPWYIYQDIELCLLDKTVFEGDFDWKGDCKKESEVIDLTVPYNIPLETHPNKKQK